MSSEKITIKEVAKKAGVSIATVSRFLNNPSLLKDECYKRVEKAVKELNFKPLLYARRLAGLKVNTFGLIIPGYEGIFFSFYALEVIRGVGMSLEKEGIDLHLHIFWQKDNFKSSLVNGVIFADIIGNEEQVQRLVKERLPVVVINHKLADENISYVAVDNFKGAYEATEFLIHHGHKKIAHLAGDNKVQCSQERFDGFRQAMEKNGLEIPQGYFQETYFSRKTAREKVELMFSLQDVPTAIFCASDEIALEVLHFCEEKKIVVPDQLSVIGFDDNPQCIYGNSMLTTVRQPIMKMSSLAVEILKDVIEKKALARKVVLEPELIVRDTVSYI